MAGVDTQKKNPIDVYMHVLRALMLRDMRTRFGGGSYLGYFILVMFPVTHIFLLVVIMAFRGLPSPMGDSTALFVATGAVPVLMFQYISNEVMKAVSANKPLMYYPQVKSFDVMFARIIVEIIKGFTGLIIVLSILFAAGINPIPVDPFVSICGYLAAILLGIGFGTINIFIVSFFPGWMLGYIVVRISMYITAGVFYLPSMFPEEIYSIMKWNPAVQLVEWVRLGYDPNLTIEVDYLYVLMFGGGSLMIGLLLERTVVRNRP